MRRFSNISTNGIIKPQKQTIRHGGYVTIYNRSNPVLLRLDQLMKGQSPRLAVTRKQGGIGDVLMTTPTVKELSKKYGVKVTYGTDFGYLDGALEKVLRYNPYIDKVIPWRDLETDKDSYDIIVDLTCPCIAHEVQKAPPVNRIDLFARYIHLPLTDTSIDYTVTEEELNWAKEYIKQYNKHTYLILVQPTSSALHRDMPVDKLKHLVVNIVKEKRNVGVLVLTHSSDNKKDVNWNDIHNVYTLNNLDVRQIAAIMKCCNLVICPDSAILHVASALHMKTFTIFGPTDPYARVNYHPEAIAYWPAKDLKNYPIWYTDIGDGYLCWKRIEVNVATDIVLSMINNKPLPMIRDIVTFGNYKTENKHYEIL